jgi:hypothetical protein
LCKEVVLEAAGSIELLESTVQFVESLTKLEALELSSVQSRPRQVAKRPDACCRHFPCDVLDKGFIHQPNTHGKRMRRLEILEG